MDESPQDHDQPQQPQKPQQPQQPQQDQQDKNLTFDVIDLRGAARHIVISEQLQEGLKKEFLEGIFSAVEEFFNSWAINYFIKVMTSLKVAAEGIRESPEYEDKVNEERHKVLDDFRSNAVELYGDESVVNTVVHLMQARGPVDVYARDIGIDVSALVQQAINDIVATLQDRLDLSPRHEDLAKMFKLDEEFDKGDE